MTDEDKIKQAYGLMRQVNDWVAKCFSISWNWPLNRISAGDRMIVDKMIGEYGKEIVRDSFLEARAQQKESLAYVRKVAKNLYEEKQKQVHIEQHEKLKKEDSVGEIYSLEKDGSLIEMLNDFAKKVKMGE